MDNNDAMKTQLEIEEAADIFQTSETPRSIEYIEDGGVTQMDSMTTQIDGTPWSDMSDEEVKTLLDESAYADGYALYGESAGFSFEVENKNDATAERPLSNHLQPNMTLKDERYKIIKTIGAGGFGVVYLARDSKFGIDVAIKELFPSSLVNRVPGEKKMIIYGKNNAKQYAYLLDRFILEARSTAKFNSAPNIVNIFDCFQENNTAYIVMEYIDSITLEKYVEKHGGKLDVDTANKIMCAILDGLSAIHAKGIIHRDIKPVNIFINDKDEVKIIDFGAARFSSTEEQIVTRYSKVFTPGFAPPEQYRADSKQGAYTDIYAASAVYYFMLTGEVPEVSVDRAVKDDIKPLREVAENVPECVERAISRALELNSDLRLQSAEELKNGILGKKLIRTVAEEKKMRFRRRIIIVAASAFVLCVAAVCVVTYKLSHADDVTIDKLLDSDTSISICVPLSNNGNVASNQLTAWENIINAFETYVEENSERKVSVEVNFTSADTYEETLKDSKPTLFCSDDAEGAKLSVIESMTSKDTSFLFSKYESNKLPDDSYTVAFDPTVLFVNEKLLSDIKKKSSSFSSVKDILKLEAPENTVLLAINDRDFEYYDSITSIEENDEYFSPLEEFCMGKIVFYIGHASDDFTIGDSMPGLYSMYEAPDIEGVRAIGYTWQVDPKGTQNEINAAQLLLAYIVYEDAQDMLFVQSGYYIPVNPEAIKKYVEYNPKLEFVSDRLDKLEFSD